MHINLEFYKVLGDNPFTTSKMELDNSIGNLKQNLPNKLPNNLRLKKYRNTEIIAESQHDMRIQPSV